MAWPSMVLLAMHSCHQGDDRGRRPDAVSARQPQQLRWPDHAHVCPVRRAMAAV
jgi:hypothetical protein